MYKVKVENLYQFEIALTSKNVSEIILARDSFSEKDLPKLVDKIKKSNKLSWILMERISRYEENMKPFDLRQSTDKIFEIKNLDGIIIQNLDSFAYMLRKINKANNEELKVELNYTMNCYNIETKQLYENLYNEKRNNVNEVPLLFTAPVELNTYELRDVGYDTMVLYSYIDTMVSANCLRKATTSIGTKITHAVQNNSIKTKQITNKNNTIVADKTASTIICKNRFDFNRVKDFSSYIIDRKGAKLHYKTYCKYCYNKIFNTEPLFLLDKAEEILGANIMHPHSMASFRIDFSFENEKEVENILKTKCPDSFTRGHIKNSIK